MAALDRPRRGPSRPRDVGKLQDRLRAWHGRTGKDAAASYFLDERRGEPRTRGSARLSDGSGVRYYTLRIGGDELLPREPSEAEEGSGEGLRAAGRVVCT